MAVRVDPPNWEELGVNAVLVDSDAPDNDAARNEIERWAAEQGFARTTELWLRRMWRADGSRWYRSFCYRLTDEERRSVDAHMAYLDDLTRQARRNAG